MAEVVRGVVGVIVVIVVVGFAVVTVIAGERGEVLGPFSI